MNNTDKVYLHIKRMGKETIQSVELYTVGHN